MTQEETIRTIVDSTRDVPGLRALFLSGSYGTGTEDAYSDIDFVLVAEDGAGDAVAAQWRNAVERTGEIVLWWDRTTVPVLINAITADWMRTDVVILKPDQLAAQTRDRLKPLFDHDGLYEGLRPTVPNAEPSAAKFLYQVEEFIRILGLLDLAVGREEYINGVLGVFHLRNMLVDLMVAETAVPNRGGLLHLNRLLTAEQRDVLLSMPPPLMEREGMIAAHLAYAEAYLPRAKARAAALDVDWPQRFEDVTWEKLRETLGIERR